MDYQEIEDVLKTMPPQFAVAFAARCVRRVLPLYRYEGNEEQAILNFQDVQHAIKLAENFACGLANSVTAINSAANAAAEAASESVGFAASSVGYAAASAAEGNDQDVISHAADAVASAIAAADSDSVVSAADLKILISMESEGRSAKIDVGEQGPLGILWSDKEPDWYLTSWNSWNEVLETNSPDSMNT